MRYEVRLVGRATVEAYTTVEANSLEEAIRLANDLPTTVSGLDWEPDPDAPIYDLYVEDVYRLPPLPANDPPAYVYRPKEKPRG